MKRNLYVAPSATQTAFQMDQMSNLTDLEFSDASGAEEKKKVKKNDFRTRLQAIKARVAAKAAKRKAKRNDRQMRKMAEALKNNKIKINVDKILEKNPKTIEPVEMVKNGIGSAIDEKITDEVLAAANKMAETGAESAPLLGEDIPTGPSPSDKTNPSASDKKTEEEKKGWSSLSKTKKVLFLGGTAIFAVLIISAILNKNNE